MLFLTADQHRIVLQRLLDLGRGRIDNVRYRRDDLAYTSLMFSFLLQNFSAAETLLRLANSIGREWYPVTVGYTIARTMSELFGEQFKTWNEAEVRSSWQFDATERAN